jgi:hypothetical protein
MEFNDTGILLLPTDGDDEFEWHRRCNPDFLIWVPVLAFFSLLFELHSRINS